MIDSIIEQPFVPHPLLRGRHAQTIAGVYYPSPKLSYTAEQHQVEVSGGDKVVLHDDNPAGWEPGRLVVLLLHGLGGSYQSGNVARIAAGLARHGIRAIRMDQRGWGAGALLARQHSHAGRSDDLDRAVERLRQLTGDSPSLMVGFSLGANILLKWLAEQGESPPNSLRHALAVAPPIDLLSCATNMRQGFNRVYDRTFVRALHRSVRQRQSRMTDLLWPTTKNLPNRLYEFDDCFTAPAAGFESAKAYYQACSTHRRLEAIGVPTEVLIAKDDPLIPYAMFEACKTSSSVRIIAIPSGGHVGFVARRRRGTERFWLDQQIVNACEKMAQDVTERPNMRSQSVPT